METDNLNLLHEPLQCLETMIKWTLIRQSKEQELKRTLSKKAWLKEYCTIKFYLPRQSGHTTAGIYLAKKYFKDPIFIVPNLKTYKRHMKIHDITKVYNIDMIDYRIKNDVDCIVADMSSFMSHTKQEKLYDLFNCTKDKNLILFLQ